MKFKEYIFGELKFNDNNSLIILLYLASLMDFHVSDDLPRNRRQMSLGLCRHKFVVVRLGFVGFSS